MKLATLASAAAVLLSAFAGTASASGLRGVAVTDYLDYDEDYYAPGYYVEDYELFGEEPLDVDFFDDEEDLDSDMELLGPKTGGRNKPQHFKDGLMNRAFRQLQNNGKISGSVARGLSSKEIRSVIRADGFRVRDARTTKSGAIYIAPPIRTFGPRRGPY